MQIFAAEDATRSLDPGPLLAPATEEAVMSDEYREFAASSNGDRWLLGRDRESGVAYVLHRANQPSGGAQTRIEIVDFLERGRLAPEHYALLVMIGTLVPEAGTLAGRAPSAVHPAPTVDAADSAAEAGAL
jgi:hypothetical protein